MNPKIGELWNISDTVEGNLGKGRVTHLVSGPGLVVKIQLTQSGDEYGDYYTVLWRGKYTMMLRNNFLEKIG